MKVLTVVGARPQFIKAAAVSRIIRSEITEFLVHTGQHYDNNMSKVFFDELHIPIPNVNLGVGSASHAKQTAEMLVKLEEVMIKENPDAVLLYGDTNSTLAGAIAAGKLNIPIAHIEAGVRCGVKDMPEEQNRIITDHLAQWNFAPSIDGIKGLESEGIGETGYFVGDVMYDALLYYGKMADKVESWIFYNKLELLDGKKIEINLENGWYLSTIHRPENTDKAEKFIEIVEALNALDKPVVFPVHPRTQKSVLNNKMADKYTNILFVEPLGYMEMIFFCKNACKIITDSGGLHKESYLMKVPGVVILRNTGWVETLDGSWNVLASPDRKDILQKVYDTKIDESKWK